MSALNDTVLLAIDALAFLLRKGGRGGGEEGKEKKELY